MPMVPYARYTARRARSADARSDSVPETPPGKRRTRRLDAGSGPSTATQIPPGRPACRRPPPPSASCRGRRPRPSRRPSTGATAARRCAASRARSPEWTRRRANHPWWRLAAGRCSSGVCQELAAHAASLESARPACSAACVRALGRSRRVRRPRAPHGSSGRGSACCKARPAPRPNLTCTSSREARGHHTRK
eukprot:6774601-Prymnesium_polylepis.2